jgi:putative endonuclease
LVVVEVKEKGGTGFGHPLEMIDAEKMRRVTAGASAWLASHPHARDLEVSFEAAGVSGRRVERVPMHLG